MSSRSFRDEPWWPAAEEAVRLAWRALHPDHPRVSLSAEERRELVELRRRFLHRVAGDDAPDA